jgi:hypothetical protein
VYEVKKFLRLRTLLALASLALVVVLLAAAQGIGQSALNQTPNQTATPNDPADEAAPAGTTQARPARDFYAVVDSDGTLARGRGAVSAERFAEGSGQYEVIFDRAVRNCAYVATIGISGSLGLSRPGEITVAARFENNRGVFVSTHNSTGVLRDRGFHLQVSC